MSLGELSARLQRAVHVARVEQQEQHTGLALPSCHRSQAARQGRRPISVHASAATIEYFDALCFDAEFYIRMLVEKVPSPALSGTWFGTLPTNCQLLPSSTSMSPSLSTYATVIEYVDALPVA